ncbi:MAG: ribonuclease Z [Gilvibacter sp.]
MKLTILGCYSATPRTHTNATAQVLELRNQTILIDCSEGTQVQLRKAKVKFSRIKHIFISHLHGDHYFGLIGLISTFQLLGRKNELHIYGPEGLKEIIHLQLKAGKSWTSYDLIFHELTSDKPELLLDTEHFTVETIPLMHRVYTNGFLFREKLGPRKLDIQKAVAAGVDTAYFNKLKQGASVPNRDGNLIANASVTQDPDTPKSYAYCSDTAYHPDIIPQLHKVTALYHEATFLQEHEHLAKVTGHSTAKQAALMAQKAEVGQLILGHYSTRYDSLDLFLAESQPIFAQTALARDLAVFEWK